MLVVEPTLPDTNSSHLKMYGWNTILSYWDGLFSGSMLVSGRIFQLAILYGDVYYAGMPKDKQPTTYLNQGWFSATWSTQALRKIRSRHSGEEKRVLLLF